MGLIVLLAALAVWLRLMRLRKRGRRLKTFGDYPPQLWRFFDTAERAEKFISGNIRFGLLDYYKAIEDGARRDTAEGAGAFTAPADRVTTVVMDKTTVSVVGVREGPGDMNYHIDFGNPTYVLSCSDPRQADIERLRAKFGRFVVLITDPRRFGQDMTVKLSELENTHPLADGVVECARVDYDKGERRDKEPTREEKLKSAYAQKPAHFSEDFEYRFVIFRRQPVRRTDAEASVTIELDGPLPYLQRLD
jgi:hypothetical protein